jgi:hypothetical protein
MNQHKVSEVIRRTLSGLGIAYKVPAGTVESPAAGQRVSDLPLIVDGAKTRLYELMRGGGFLLVDTEGTAATAAAPWRGRVTAVEVKGRLMDSATALLIRPDGYLAWSGVHPDAAEISMVLTQWCGGPLRSASR